MSEFESLGLKIGIWQGILRRETPPGRLMLVHMGSPVAEALATAEPEGGEGMGPDGEFAPLEDESDGDG